MESFYAECERLSLDMVRAISENLGMPAQHLDCVLQFVTNRGRELTARRLSSTDSYAEKAVRAGHTDPVLETRSDTDSTMTLLNIDYAVAVANRLDQTTERWRALIASGDSCINRGDDGTDSRNPGRVLVSKRRSVHDER